MFQLSGFYSTAFGTLAESMSVVALLITLFRTALSTHLPSIQKPYYLQNFPISW